MYTAKINRKEYQGGVLKIFVDFVDGGKLFTESCIPQDEDGFKYWLKSRLASYNSSVVLDAELTPGDVIDMSEPLPPVLTQAEIDRNTWLEKYSKWVRIKTTVVDTGIVPATQPKLQGLLDDLKATLKPEYIDYI